MEPCGFCQFQMGSYFIVSRQFPPFWDTFFCHAVKLKCCFIKVLVKNTHPRNEEVKREKGRSYRRLRAALASFFSSSDLSADEFSSSSLSSLLMSELLEECVERAKPPGRPKEKRMDVRMVGNHLRGNVKQQMSLESLTEGSEDFSNVCTLNQTFGFVEMLNTQTENHYMNK